MDEFDPVGLDWSRHSTERNGREYGSGLFLAEAGRRIGEAMIQGWHGGEGRNLASAVRPVHHDVPSPAIAFEGDRPVPKVHAAFGPYVRDVISPAAWADLDLRIRDPQAWLRAHVPDPAGGPPLTPDALRAREGTDRDDPIARDNWTCAYEITTLERWVLRTDADRMAAIARAVAEMAIGGDIAMLARPVAGGASVPVDGSIWHCGPEQRIRRFASCAVNLARPHDPDAAADHLLFVGEDRFESSVALYGKANWIPLPALAGLDDGAKTPKAQRWPDLEHRIEQLLREELSQPERDNWRLSDLVFVATDALGTSVEPLVPAVRDRLAKDFPFLSKPGQPRKDRRPSLRRRAN